MKQETRAYTDGRTNRYFQTLLYLTLALTLIQVVLPPISHSAFYTALLGYTGLTFEASLPLPQILKNHQARSCKGFRLSVIANWLVGDLLKMSYFFLGAGGESTIPLAFKLCGLFQMGCDLFLGLQFYLYGDGGHGTGLSSVLGLGPGPGTTIPLAEKRGEWRPS